MKICTIISAVSKLVRQCLALYMSLSEQNEDLTIALIYLSIIIWLSKINLMLRWIHLQLREDDQRIRGGQCIEHIIDISILLSFLHIKLAISHGLISLMRDSMLSFAAPGSERSQIRYNWLSSTQKWYFVPLWWAVMIFPRGNTLACINSTYVFESLVFNKCLTWIRNRITLLPVYGVYVDDVDYPAHCIITMRHGSKQQNRIISTSAIISLYRLTRYFFNSIQYFYFTWILYIITFFFFFITKDPENVFIIQ